MKLRGAFGDKWLHDREIGISRLIGCDTTHEGNKVTQCKACQKRLRTRAKRKAK